MHALLRKKTPAFTLVELLMVIVIISLLIGILLPAVGAIRTRANGAATQSVLATLSTGLEAYRAEQRLGGAYPPSRSDRGGMTAAQLLAVRSPYVANANTDIEMHGAGLLFWAMAGADLLGTPGFKAFRTGGSPPNTLWSLDSDSFYNGSNSGGAYALHDEATLAGEPLQPRTSAFVSLDKIRYTKNIGGSGAPNFAIDLEKKLVNNPPVRDYPMFLDAFGQPVLYWRADPAGSAMADKVPQTGILRGIYHWIDNAALIAQDSNVGTGDKRLHLTDDDYADPDAPHRLDWGGGNYDPVNNLPPRGTFEAYILNENTRAKLVPAAADSYLLISAGPDGIFGSSDDITNFRHNGK